MNSLPLDAKRRSILFLGAEAAYMWNFRSALLKHFRASGYRVIVVAPASGIDPAIFRDAGIEFIDWPVKRAAIGFIADLAHVWALWRVLRRVRPAVLFTHTIKPVIYGLLLGWLAGIPRRVAMIPGLGFAFIEGASRKRRIAGVAARLGYRLALRRAHLVILQNPDDRQALLEYRALSGTTPTAIVNGSGVDLHRFQPQPLPAGPLTFLMVARLLFDKGVLEFVEAARTVKQARPEIRFVLAGAADDNPAAVPAATIEEWRKEGLVELRGFVGDPRAEYAGCHVYVLPSYREGTPRTSLEAMATGRAIVTTDAPGCRETVRHGVNGLTVPIRDASRLAAAMIELADDPELVESMGQASLRLCQERYELNAVTEATAALIEGTAPALARTVSN